MTLDTPIDMDKKIDLWRDKLILVSRRNRLLYFKSLKRGNLRLDGIGTNDLLQLLLNEEYTLLIAAKPVSDECDDGDSFLVTKGNQATLYIEKDKMKNILKIASQGKLNFNEQGINTMFLALGFLKWTDSKDSLIENLTPIILLPVQLNKKTGMEIELKYNGDEINKNPALIFKMKNDFGVNLNYSKLDQDSINSEEIFSSIMSHFQDSDIFASWEILDESYLGIFSYQKLVMYEDLNKNRVRIKENKLLKILAGDVSEKEKLPALSADIETEERHYNPKKVYQILDADSSQTEAIIEAKNGGSFVLQGPPGTGKSQTIANIIAELIADGKKVLFVSQKRAALDVVFNRLDECGLADYCLKAHETKGNKKEVIQEFGRILNSDKYYYPSKLDYSALEDTHRKLWEYHRLWDKINRYPSNQNKLCHRAVQKS